MRIGIYSNYYKPIINGVVRSVTTFRDELIRQGHTVYVFAPQVRGYVDHEPGIFRYRALRVKYRAPASLAIPFSPSIDQRILELKLDLIHSQHPVALGNEALRQARRCRVPLVFTYHSHYEVYVQSAPFGRRVLAALAHKLVRRYMTHCHRIITPTESARQIIAERHPELSSRLVTLPTPIDVAAYRHLDPRPIRERYGLAQGFTFVVVARLSVEKGVSKVIQAFEMVARGHVHAQLLIVGDGPRREHLVRQARALGIEGRVHFAGPVPYAQIPDHLAAADVFAYASRAEMQPLALTEAMAAGLPVVAMDATGVRDVVRHGEDGLLVAPNAQALAGAMRHLMHDEALRKRLSVGARATASRCSIEGATSRLLEIYDKAIVEMTRTAV